MLAVALLGPLEVSRAGSPLVVPTGKTTELFIRLALDAGITVRADRLIEDLWRAEATQRNTLQAKVSQLRRALDGAAPVSGGAGGYCLELDPAAVDALEVPRLAATVSAALAAGRARAATETATQALGFFRGEILADAGDGDWVLPHRVRLENAQHGLTEDLLTARLELGDAAAVLGELEALVIQYPLRERLWGLLITALYRQGRQIDALAAYQRIRHQLADELGVDPGPDLRALERRILVHDETLAPPRAMVEVGVGVEPRASTPNRPGNLPALSAALIGRATEQAEVTELLAERRLVTLVGPAGVGKTRLAIELGRGDRSLDGAWLVRLENARTSAAVPLALGEAFGMSGATEAMVIERLRTNEALIVLDNCEHVLDAAAELASRLLDSVPGLRVLVTSQAPLGLDGEAVHLVEPLVLADSIALFVQRATEHRKSFATDAHSAAAIADVCQALDGLPLAIELAAARTKVLSVPEIARRLDDRFSLLNDLTGRRPERHRALSTAIAWSYELLFPDEQRGLWALACFAAGAPLAAAERVVTAVGVPPESALDVISRLADRSFVSVDVGRGGSVRYRLLDSVRAFALARLAEAGLETEARRAHADWVGSIGALAAAEQHGPRLVDHVTTSLEERANIDAALAWSAVNDPPLGLRIANGFGWMSVILGDGAVAAQRLRDALSAAGHEAPIAERALAYALMAWDEAAADLTRARAEAEESSRLAEAAGDPDAIAASCFALGFVLMQQGQPRALFDLLDGWRATQTDLARTWNLGVWCTQIGYAGMALGDIARIRAACAESADLLETLDDGWLASQFEAIRAGLAQAEGRPADAAIHFGRAVAYAEDVGLPATAAFHLANLGRAQHLAGDLTDAVATFERAIEVGRSVGLMRIVAFSRVRLGRVLVELGERIEARAELIAADDWFRASGGGGDAALGQCLLAVLDADDGVADAGARLIKLLAAAEVAEDHEVQALARAALGRLEAATG